MNLGRTLVVSSNVFREIIRDRVLYLIGFFAVALIAAAMLIPQVAAGNESKIIIDFGLAAINLLGLVITIFVGTALINKEIEKRTIYVLIAKPVSRAEFVVGKHVGLSAVIAVLLAAMTAIFMGVLSVKQIPFPADSILLTVLFQLLELSLIAGVAILFGVFTSSLLAMMMTVAVYLMGHFSRDIVSLGKMAENPGVRQMTQNLYLVLPDLSRFNLKNEAIYGMSLLPQPLDLLGSAVYGLVWIGLVLAIAVVIFSRREF
jgi:ABC-type transport system involved in multi-copper enzyme maturation permease subunit